VYQKATVYANVHSSGLGNFRGDFGVKDSVNVIVPGTSGKLKKFLPVLYLWPLILLCYLTWLSSLRNMKNSIERLNVASLYGPAVFFSVAHCRCHPFDK